MTITIPEEYQRQIYRYAERHHTSSDEAARDLIRVAFDTLAAWAPAPNLTGQFYVVQMASRAIVSEEKEDRVSTTWITHSRCDTKQTAQQQLVSHLDNQGSFNRKHDRDYILTQLILGETIRDANGIFWRIMQVE